MMIMEGGNMSQTEYDLKAIMYSAYDIPHKLYDVRRHRVHYDVNVVVYVCCRLDVMIYCGKLNVC